MTVFILAAFPLFCWLHKEDIHKWAESLGESFGRGYKKGQKPCR